MKSDVKKKFFALLLMSGGPGYVAAPVSWDSTLRLRISFV